MDLSFFLKRGRVGGYVSFWRKEVVLLSVVRITCATKTKTFRQTTYYNKKKKGGAQLCV